MRRIGLLVVAVLSLTSAACRCGIERETVGQLETSLTRTHGKFLKYVEADGSLSATQKQIERDHVQSEKDIVGSLKRATK